MCSVVTSAFQKSAGSSVEPLTCLPLYDVAIYKLSHVLCICDCAIFKQQVLLWTCLLKTQPSVIQVMDLKSFRSPVSPLDLLCMFTCVDVHYLQSATYSMNCEYPSLWVSLHLLFRNTSPILSVLPLWLECMDLGALFLLGTTIVQKQNWCVTKPGLFMGLLSITPHLQRWGHYLSQSSLVAHGSQAIIQAWWDRRTCNTWE